MRIEQYADLPYFDFERHKKVSGLYRPVTHPRSSAFNAMIAGEVDVIEVKVTRTGHFRIRSYMEKVD